MTNSHELLPQAYSRLTIGDSRSTIHYFRSANIILMKELIIEAWNKRELLKDNKYFDAVKTVIEELDKGRLRVASPSGAGWAVNEWVKQAILMYFGIQPMQTWNIEPFEFYDKMLLKKNYKELGVRAVPHAVARYGAYLAKNVVLMPSLCKYWRVCR